MQSCKSTNHKLCFTGYWFVSLYNMLGLAMWLVPSSWDYIGIQELVYGLSQYDFNLLSINLHNHRSYFLYILLHLFMFCHRFSLNQWIHQWRPAPGYSAVSGSSVSNNPTHMPSKTEMSCVIRMPVLTTL